MALRAWRSMPHEDGGALACSEERCFPIFPAHATFSALSPPHSAASSTPKSRDGPLDKTRRTTKGGSLPVAELTPRRADEAPWDAVLESERRWFDLRWRELWAYRDLVWLFVRRDFTATYKQTFLGPLWYLLQPLFTTLTFVLIFGYFAKVPTDGLPRVLFFLSGIVAWNYFADCLTKTANTFTGNAAIFGKIYFPRLVVPLSVVITNMITFLIQFALFLVLLGFFWWKGAPVFPNYRVIILPLLVLQMALLGLGVGAIVSSVTTRWRDVGMLVGFGTQLWMYASSVVLPLSVIPEKLRWLFVLNPMVPIIETFRFAFLGRGVVEIWQLMVSLGITLAIFLFGIAIFTRVERNFMDTV
jgi:lipopolysaccharide transport system permease protein